MPVASLPQGNIHYADHGPADGRPVVFVHGYLMGGELFAELATRLANEGLRCIAPTWPLGAHTEPMAGDADVTPRGVAAIIAAFMEHLELADVVLLGNDTGGALCQIVATEHPERIGALVLTNCDAFDNFPPLFFKTLVRAAAVPGALRAALAPMRSARVRRSALGYGLLSHGDVDHLAREWVKPIFSTPGVMEDLRRFTAAMDTEITLEAARKLTALRVPALLAWATDDRLFPLEHARRLAEIIPHARLETIEQSRAFSMVDQPDTLARLVGEFARSENAPLRQAPSAA